MKEYLELGRKILEEGAFCPGRAGSETYSLFGEQLKFDLMDGFPIPTTQDVNIKPLAAELIWILSGSTNNNDLVELGAKFWDSWALKEDINKETPLSGYDRAAMLADRTGRTTADVIKQLNSMSYEDAEKFLSDAAIPKHKVVPFIKAGELGPVYGEQWRNFANVDQILELLDNLQSQPYSRRHVVSGWNPAVLPTESRTHEHNIMNGKQVLPCCHTMWQIYVRPATKAQVQKYLKYQLAIAETEEQKAVYYQHLSAVNTTDSQEELEVYLTERCLPKARLSLQLYARSQDFPVGTVVNIPSYALLTHLLAMTINAIPGDYIHTMGDVHVYANQVEKFKQQLEREPRPLPHLKINRKWMELTPDQWNAAIADGTSPFNYRVGNISDNPAVRERSNFKDPAAPRFSVDDFQLVNYEPHSRITYKVLV